MSNNMYAGASIQVFPGGDVPLSTPHSDVGAFLGYVGQFAAINFHAKDDDVREWRYNREYDNWQDRLGMDSVRVYYHYGHCGMRDDGGFVAAMGRTWDDTFLADSTRMSFGDQRLRYLFLHGRDSLQMHSGQNPFRTWGQANHGARMIFGFDGLTYDIDGLGAGFFREWNTGKSFSQAWQDSALGIFTDHRPASTACGATPEEAQQRLWNERLFDGAAVSDNWYWWRWAGPAPIEVDTDVRVPRSPGLNLQLGRRRGDARTGEALAQRFGVRCALTGSSSPEAETYNQPRDLAGQRLVLSPDGSYRIFLAEPDLRGGAWEARSLRNIVDRTVSELDLDVDVAFHGWSATHHAGASRKGDVAVPAIRDFTAHFRQIHEGVPVTKGGDGHLTVTLDTSGTVCAIANRTVPIVGAAPASPAERHAKRDPEAALRAGVEALRRRLSCDSSHELQLTVVPGSTEIGYRLDSDTGAVIARQEIEIGARHFRIRKIVEVPL